MRCRCLNATLDLRTRTQEVRQARLFLSTGGCCTITYIKELRCSPARWLSPSVPEVARSARLSLPINIPESKKNRKPRFNPLSPGVLPNLPEVGERRRCRRAGTATDPSHRRRTYANITLQSR